MKAGELFKILKDNFSTGTLSPDDDIIVHSKNGSQYIILNAECDTQTSDFLIELEDY
jgi:hypothetical protein